MIGQGIPSEGTMPGDPRRGYYASASGEIGEVDCEEWARRLLAGEAGLSFPTPDHPCFPVLQARAAGRTLPVETPSGSKGWGEAIPDVIRRVLADAGLTLGLVVGGIVALSVVGSLLAPRR